MAIGLFVPRSLGASPAPSGRVVVIRVCSESLSDIFPVVEYAEKHGWNSGLAIMSAPYRQDMAWLESLLYSGLRGLQGSSRQRYGDKMAKHALVPMPNVLTMAGLGWSVEPKSGLLGESPSHTKTRLFISSTKSLRKPIRAINELNPKFDAMVIVCGPLQGTRILSVAVLGGPISGLLTSPTSRSFGVVSDTDLRGSVLSLLGVKPERLAHQWSVTPADAGSSRSRCERVINLCQINSPLIIWVGVVAGIACILLICSCLTKSEHWRGLNPLRAVFAASLAMLPLASCELGRWIVSGFYRGDKAGLLLFGTCVAGGVVGCIAVKFRAWAAVRLVMFLTIVYVSSVTMMGYEWVYTSVISSYVLTGIRLYGLGNEFMGILVGGCLMMLSSSSDRRIAYLLLSILAVVFAVGMWGANLGGFATCVAAMVSLALYGKTIGARKIGYGLAMGIGLIVAMFMMPWPIMVDSMMLVPTHMGEAAIRSELLGQYAVVSLFISKLSLFGRVMFMPFGLLSVVGFIAVLWYSTNRMRRYTTPERASLYTSWIKIGGFASIPALVFNDSGIVPAVIIMACVMIYALLLHIDGKLPTHG